MKHNDRAPVARLARPRGLRYEGGLYVGTTPAGIEWVARTSRHLSEREAFARMVERFDSKHRPHAFDWRTSEWVEITAEELTREPYAALWYANELNSNPAKQC